MFDAHTHLQDQRLDGCRIAILKIAAEAGIRGLSVCGTSPADWGSVARLSREQSSPVAMHPAFGVHPWFCDKLAHNWLEHLDDYLTSHPQAAVGEIGIDGIRRALDPALQQKVFSAQLELAIKHQRAVVVHGARCWGRLEKMLQPYAPKLPSIILHGFAASAELVKSFLKMGATFSMVGSLCNPNARRVHAAAAAIPLDHLLIETDTPDILPYGATPLDLPGLSETCNHPANLRLVATALAQIKQVDVAEIEALTTRNAHRAFNLKESDHARLWL